MGFQIHILFVFMLISINGISILNMMECAAKFTPFVVNIFTPFVVIFSFYRVIDGFVCIVEVVVVSQSNIPANRIQNPFFHLFCFVFHEPRVEHFVC